MTAVYSCSTITIAASAASDATDGLTLHRPVSTDLDDGITITLHIGSLGDDMTILLDTGQRDWKEGPEYFLRTGDNEHPVHRRAWAMQERLISRVCFILGAEVCISSVNHVSMMMGSVERNHTPCHRRWIIFFTAGATMSLQG
jgi:hypothetical protein